VPNPVTNEPNQRALAAADARNRILAAAAECIVRGGLAKVRMAGIAKAAGVSAGLLHYHFDTKEQLFADVLTYSHEVSGVLNEQALRGAGDQPAQRLSSFLDRCLPSDKQLADGPAATGHEVDDLGAVGPLGAFGAVVGEAGQHPVEAGHHGVGHGLGVPGVGEEAPDALVLGRVEGALVELTGVLVLGHRVPPSDGWVGQ